MRRFDIDDGLLAALIFIAALFLAAYFFTLPFLPAAWRLPGSPLMYLIAVVGTFFLLVSVAFLFAKRTGRGGSPVRWFSAHVVTATLGGVLVTIHSGGRLQYAPALLLLALLGLVVLGVWARLRASRMMSATFASRPGGLISRGMDVRGRLAGIVREKEELLTRLEPEALEGTFSLTLAHWLRSPGLSAGYAKLVHEESRLLGGRRAVGVAQAYWRWVHIALAVVFIVGIFAHVVAVTFFAGYVSGGGEIYWRHLRAW